MGYQTIFIMTEYPHNKEMVIIKSGLMPDDLAERSPKERAAMLFRGRTRDTL